MTQTALMAQATDQYRSLFGAAAGGVAYAPGRVNLLGEHTDYNGGFVLPMPLAIGTAVALGQGGTPGSVTCASTSFDGTVTRHMGDAANDSWTDYILGSLMQIFGPTAWDTGWCVMVHTNLPVGSGLSSSAALEVALMRAYCDLMGHDIDPVTIAQMARAAENQFVGVPCGIMDQYSVSVGTPGTAVFLNTRTLDSALTPLPGSHAIVVIHSGVSHQLSDGGYKQRVAECQAACQALQVDMLSDLTLDDLPRIADLPAPLDGRARHIVTENDRVQRAVQALTQGNMTLMGDLMVASHASQRDDYAVSVPAIDALVQGALDAGATGARLTGGGFGGSTVALVDKTLLAGFQAAIETGFPNARILAVT
ncbi:MAG: galactokinase [Pseudomonadota bacterium]